MYFDHSHPLLHPPKSSQIYPHLLTAFQFCAIYLFIYLFVTH